MTNNIWQGSVKVGRMVKTPFYKSRSQWTCPYCHTANITYFIENTLRLKPAQEIHETCYRCKAVWEIIREEGEKETDNATNE